MQRLEKKRRCLWPNKDAASVSRVFLICEEMAYQSPPTKCRATMGGRPA